MPDVIITSTQGTLKVGTSYTITYLYNPELGDLNSQQAKALLDGEAKKLTAAGKVPFYINKVETQNYFYWGGKIIVELVPNSVASGFTWYDSLGKILSARFLDVRFLSIQEGTAGAIFENQDEKRWAQIMALLNRGLLFAGAFIIGMFLLRNK